MCPVAVEDNRVGDRLHGQTKKKGRSGHEQDRRVELLDKFLLSYAGFLPVNPTNRLYEYPLLMSKKSDYEHWCREPAHTVAAINNFFGQQNSKLHYRERDLAQGLARASKRWTSGKKPRAAVCLSDTTKGSVVAVNLCCDLCNPKQKPVAPE
jgi:hypothetical protein